MSSRRLARAGKVSRSATGVPPALASRNDPIWEDERRVQALARAHGIGSLVYYEPRFIRLTPPRHASHPNAWTRFDAFRHAWCMANGLERTDEFGRGCVDPAKARALGIEMSTSRLDFYGYGAGSHDYVPPE